MSPFELTMIAIRGLATLTNNPLLGGGSNLRLQQVSELLGKLEEYLSRGKEGYDDLVVLTNVVKQMVAENRGPTTSELLSLRARSDSAHGRLQAAKAKLDEGEEDDPLLELLKDDLLAQALDRGLPVNASLTKAELVVQIRRYDELMDLLKEDLIREAEEKNIGLDSSLTKAEIVRLIMEQENAGE